MQIRFPKPRLHKDNALMYVFFFGNFIYGAGFATFGFWSGVNTSSLYQSMHEVEPWLPKIWGMLLVAAVLLCVVPLRRYLGGIGSYLGIACWVYASLVYFLTGYFLVFLSVSIIYLTFWVYFNFKFIYSCR